MAEAPAEPLWEVPGVRGARLPVCALPHTDLLPCRTHQQRLYYSRNVLSENRHQATTVRSFQVVYRVEPRVEAKASPG